MGFCWLRMIALPLGQMFYTVQKTTLASLVTFFVCNYVRLGLGRQTAQYSCVQGARVKLKRGMWENQPQWQSKSEQGAIINVITNLREKWWRIVKGVLVWHKLHKRAVGTFHVLLLTYHFVCKFYFRVTVLFQSSFHTTWASLIFEMELEPNSLDWNGNN